MYEYVSFYADIVKSLQKLKTNFLNSEFIVDNTRKIYFKRIKIQHFIDRERLFFQILQILLFKFSYLVYANLKRRFYIDLNVSKEFDFNVMMYYIKFEIN